MTPCIRLCVERNRIAPPRRLAWIAIALVVMTFGAGLIR